jgi:hypothetical protein
MFLKFRYRPAPEAFVPADDPAQTLSVFTAEPGGERQTA